MTDSIDLQQIEEEQAEVKVANKALGAINPGDDETRQEVARKFVKYYFWILILIIVGIPIYNYFAYKETHNTSLILPLKDIILTYSAVVGPTIGLVVAYYFKSSND